MKTTKRSKILLSSIAMLLVALVALGSATYAWYVVNQEVTASSISVKAAAADGLVGKKTNDGAISTWGNSVALVDQSSAANLNPASIDTTAKTYIVNAVGTDLDDGDFGTQTAALSDTALTTASTTAYLYDDYYIKSTNGNISGVKFQVQATADADAYLNCLVFVDGTFVGGSSIHNAASTTIRKADGTGTNSITLTALNTDFGNLTVGSSAKHVEIYVYADGEDDLCTTYGANTDSSSFTVYCHY